MARSRSVDHPMPPEGCWIKYQLDLRNIKLETVANKAGLTVATVSRVIRGTRKSEKARTALAQTLGYPSWRELWAAAFISAERRAM